MAPDVPQSIYFPLLLQKELNNNKEGWMDEYDGGSWVEGSNADPISFSISLAEILKSNSAMWMSSDGQYLVYASFNDSLVGENSYHWYGDNLAYPKLRTLRYPKVNM
jgi:hypothetical protein